MAATPRFRPTTAHIDLGAIRHNTRLIQARLPPGAEMLVAVKADAYGHGLRPVARVLAEEGVGWLGVAMVEEGITLRRAGAEVSILVLGGPSDGSEKVCLEANLTPVVYRSATVRALNALAASRGRPVAVHLKVDTGMNRLGVPVQLLGDFLDLLEGLEHLYVDGVLTHLAEAEAGEEEFTEAQLRDFADAAREIRRRGHRPTWVHSSNSAALMMGRSPSAETGANLVRPGISVYGHAPDAVLEGAWPLRPAMSWVTAVSFLKKVPTGAQLSYGRTWTASRPSKVAALPVGYGDGYARALGNRAEVLVGGMRAPVVGKVCMDIVLVDVTDVPHVREGDPVVLLGEQGAERVTASELATILETIPYEVLCAVSPRVPRTYQDDDKPPGAGLDKA